MKNVLGMERLSKSSMGQRVRWLSSSLGWFIACHASLLQAEEPLPALRVSADHRSLETVEGKPFFYLGDTAWEIFHRLTIEEAEYYLNDRASKGFTVIQAVALAEFDGLNEPNAYGHRPLVELDPSRPAIVDGPNNDYWDHVDAIIDLANQKGLRVGLLPTWGDKWNVKWGKGPLVFTTDNAETYGRWIGTRYKNRSVIWILGGDRPVETPSIARS